MNPIPYPLWRRVSLTLRLALICTLVTLTTIYYGTPEPALVAYLAFFINRDDRVTSDMFSVAMLILATVMIGLVFLLMQALVDHPLGRIISMTLLSFILLFLTSASRLKSIGGILSLVLAFALDLMGATPMTELLTRGLLYAWLFVAIPAGVSILVNRLLAPTPAQLLDRIIAQRLDDAAQVLRGTRDLDWLQPAMAAYEADLPALLKKIRLQRTLSGNDLERLGSVVDSSNALLLAVGAWAQQPNASSPQSVQLAQILEDMALAFRTGTGLAAVPTTIVAPVYESATQREIWEALTYVVLHFSVPRAALSVLPAQHDAAPGGFFVADAWSNPEHWRYAVKTTAAAMLCYLFYSALSWPGIHTCMITCYLVSLATVAESVEKLVLRIAGCLIGAILGLATLIFVLPQLTSAAAYLSVVFAGSLAAAWYASSSQRVSYMGVQMAFAFFICVIQGSGPSFDMTGARDRIVGILIGNLVLYLITTRLWPVSIGQRIAAQVRALNTTIDALGKSISYGAFLQALNRALADLNQLRTDLWRVRYERLPGALATTQGLHDGLQKSILRLRQITVAMAVNERNTRAADNVPGAPK